MIGDLDNAYRDLANALITRHPDEAALAIEGARTEEIVDFFEQQKNRQSAEVFNRLTPDTAAQAVAKMTDESARRILSSLNPNRSAALIARLESDVRQNRLALLEPSLAKELNELIAYPRDTAGGMMDPRVTAFRPEQTVREIIPRLRALRHKRIQDLFLVDSEGMFVGSIALQDVVLAERSEKLGSLISGSSPTVQATDSRETVVSELESRRVSSLPVVDFNGRLLGVLRQQELINAARQEDTADLLTMVGASKDERALSRPLFAVKKRLPWLQINLVTAFLAASVVGLFEGTIAKFTALAVLLPVVAGQSGNTGAQALAVTMRGLALREIRVRHWLRVSVKEFVTGALNGFAIALTTSIGVLIWSRSIGLTWVIGISMVLSMVAAGVVGALIPIMLTSLRQDPAQSSSIILTTVTDVVGFFSFLGIATLFISSL